MTRDLLEPRRVATRWGLAALASVGVHLVLLGAAVAALSLRAPTVSASAVAPPRAPTFTRVGLFGAAPRTARTAVAEPAAGLAAVPGRPVARAPRAVAPADGPPADVASPPAVDGAPERSAATPTAVAGEANGGAQGAPGSLPGAEAHAGAASSSPAAAQGAVVVPAEDVDALVHAQLVRVAARCYPAAARRFRQVGEVFVHFCVDQAGAVGSTQVQRSSQSPLLDGAATQCVVPQAAPFPAAAAGRCFEVPVRFGAP